MHLAISNVSAINIIVIFEMNSSKFNYNIKSIVKICRMKRKILSKKSIGCFHRVVHLFCGYLFSLYYSLIFDLPIRLFKKIFILNSFSLYTLSGRNRSIKQRAMRHELSSSIPVRTSVWNGHYFLIPNISSIEKAIWPFHFYLRYFQMV